MPAIRFFPAKIRNPRHNRNIFWTSPVERPNALRDDVRAHLAARKDGPGIGDPDYNKYSQRSDATSTIPLVIAVTKKPVWTLSMPVLPFG
jgi:hypothetical protein